METLTLPDLDIVRTWHLPVRADDSGDDRLATMEVRFSKFDTWYEINSWWEGKFLERTVKGAFRKTIRESGPSVKVMFNHGYDMQIDSKLLGSVESLAEEDDSPVGVVAMFDTTYNRDLLPGLRAGVYGSSFMFRVIKDEWNNEPEPSDDNPEGLPERTIKEVRLFEFGPVTWPANPDATSALRCVSGTDAYYEQMRSRDPHRVEQLRTRIGAIRTPDAPPAAAALAPVGAAQHHTDEPDTHSSGDPRRAQRARRIREARLAALT